MLQPDNSAGTAFAWSLLPSGDPGVHLSVGTKRIGSNMGKWYCRTKAFIDSTVEDAAAYFFLVNLQTNRNSFLDAGHIARDIQTTNGVNDMIVGTVFHTSHKILKPREVIARWVWGRLGNALFIAIVSHNDELDVDYRVRVPKTRRMDFDRIMIFRPKIKNDIER